MRQSWFHGDISRDKAVSLLTAESHLSGWLVRTSDQVSYPFTLSRIIHNKEKKPEFNHMRICYNNTENKLMIDIKPQKDKKKKQLSPEWRVLPSLKSSNNVLVYFR